MPICGQNLMKYSIMFRLNQYQWFRRLRGGKWYRKKWDLGGLSFGKYWTNNPIILEHCEELIETEDWTKKPK